MADKTISLVNGKDRYYLAPNKIYQIDNVSIIQNISGGEIYVSDNDIDKENSTDLGDDCRAFNGGNAVEKFASNTYDSAQTIYVEVGSTGCDVFMQ
jgi:hypothetical protein